MRCCSPVGKDDMLLQFSTDKDLRLCKPWILSGKATRLWHSLSSKYSNEDSLCKSSGRVWSSSHQRITNDSSVVKHPKVEGMEIRFLHELMVREVREALLWSKLSK